MVNSYQMSTEANKTWGTLELSNEYVSHYSKHMSASVFQIAISEIKRLVNSSYQMLIVLIDNKDAVWDYHNNWYDFRYYYPLNPYWLNQPCRYFPQNLQTLPTLSCDHS